MDYFDYRDGELCAESVPLSQIAADYGTPELGIVAICFDFAARLRSYELIAEACRS